MKKNTVLIFLKGKTVKDEILEAKKIGNLNLIYIKVFLIQGGQFWL